MKTADSRRWRLLALALLICIGIALPLARLLREEDTRASRRSVRTAARQRSQAIPSQSETTRRAASPDKASSRIGILVCSSETWKWQPDFAKAAKWMNEWTIPCAVIGFPGMPPEVLRSACAREGLRAEVFPFERAVEELKVLLLIPPSERDKDIISRLKDCVGSGTWLVVPEGSQMVSEILGISSERTETLNSTLRGGHLSSSQARCLVHHPILAQFPSGEWISAETLHGEAVSLTPRRTVGLPLMQFKDPQAVAVRVVPVGNGGIVDLNWDSFSGGEIGLVEARTILRNVLGWLGGRDDWRAPMEEPLLTVRGKIVTNDGGPVPKAEVKVRVFAEWGGKASDLTATSGDDGTFTLPSYAPSIYDFEVSAEGYFQEDPFVMARCELGREDGPTVIRMRRTAALYGVVYHDADRGNPASEFAVLLLPADRDGFAVPQETTTDEHGEFAFEKVEHGGTVLLIAEKNEWAGSKVVEMPLERGEEPARVEVEVSRLPGVIGKVIDVEGGIPVPGAEVNIDPDLPETVMGLFSDRLNRKVRTQEDGSFAVVLVPGCWYLYPTAEGYATLTSWDAGEQDSGSATVTVSKTSPQQAVVLKMRKAGLVRFYGTVYLPSGEPAPGATVAVSESGVSRVGGYTTDPIGRYTTDRVGPLYKDNEGKKVFYFTVRRGSLAAFEELKLDSLSEELQQDFRLGEGLTISGFVWDSKGNPVEGATVFSADRFSHRGREEGVLSAADGSFVLEGFAPRLEGIWLRAEKVVSAGGALGRYVGELRVSLPWLPVGPLEDVEIIVARTGDISGRVLFHDGSPLRNASVTFRMFYPNGELWKDPSAEYPGVTVLLGDEGEFRIGTPLMSRLLMGRLRGESRILSYEPDTIPRESGRCDILVHPETPGSREGAARADTVVSVRGVEPGTSDLEIRLPPLGAIAGRVIDAWSHEPFAMLPVEVRTEDDELPQQRTVASGTLSLQGGVFRVEGLVPRTYQLTLNPRGYRKERLLVRVPEGGQELNLGEIALMPSWTVFGRLIEEGTGRWAKAKITASSQTVTTVEGIFLLELTPTRSVQVQVVPEDENWEEVTLEVEYQGQPETHLGTIVLKPRSDTADR